MENVAISTLREIGLNQLEAEVYYLLLCEEPMTAYKAGKLLKKPTANIYKAVDVLSKKGAVVFEEGKNKLCKAIAPDDFIAIQAQNFAAKAKIAAKTLAQVKPKIVEDGTYTLDSVGLAVEKAKNMVDSAQVVVVIDAFPLALEAILTSVRNAVSRGVKVLVQAYGRVDIPNADVFLTENYDEVLTYWKSEQLNVIADGNECLIALFDQNLKTVFHATWSTNVYLSCILHAGRLCEQNMHKLLSLPESPNRLKEIDQILNKQNFFRNTAVPGVQILFDRYLEDKNESKSRL